ncbi:MAG: hypothetical protein FD129_3389, partial [bacterium]
LSKLVWMGVLAVGLMAGTAHAQGVSAEKLEGTLTAQVVKVDPATRKEAFRPADKVVPRDVVQYSLKYRNISGTKLTKVELVIPVPPGTSYVEKSAQAVAGAALEFSIDGGREYKKPPLMIRTRTPQGERLVPAGPEKVTHVKWTVSRLLPDERFTSSCRVTVK